MIWTDKQRMSDMELFMRERIRVRLLEEVRAELKKNKKKRRKKVEKS